MPFSHPPFYSEMADRLSWPVLRPVRAFHGDTLRPDQLDCVTGGHALPSGMSCRDRNREEVDNQYG